MSVSRYHLTSFDYYCTTAESEDFFSFFSSLMTTKNSESFSRRNLALSKEKDHWFNAILALGLLFSNDLLEYYDFNSGMYYSYPRILQFSIIEVSLDCIQKSCERSELYFVFLSYLQNWRFPHGFCFDFICYVERSKDGVIFRWTLNDTRALSWIARVEKLEILLICENESKFCIRV